MKALVAYATRYGSTQEVAEAVATTLRDGGHAVDVMPLRKVRNLAGYHTVVIGAPLYMFHWHRDAKGFLAHHMNAIKTLRVAVFALGPFFQNDEKECQEARRQLDSELAQFPWFAPCACEVFGGRFDPAKIRFPLKPFLKKIPAADFRDWNAIRAWAGSLAGKE
ncbi:MAG: flavodoxin domain-containing protein [Armatimonadetes bacterium]|nr:flavodoxin domain-containing protein [Armatimonadota bacterium]